MSTTVTTNLALIKPDEDESIAEDLPTFSGWATQNAANCEIIDGLFRASTATPSFTFSAESGGFVLGAGGFTTFKTLRLFPRMVFVFFRIYAGGAGFAAGSGNYQITGITPAIDSAFSTFNTPIEIPVGTSVFRDDSAALTSGIMTAIFNTGGPSVSFRNPGGTKWTAADPVTMAQQDRASGYFMYPTSAV